MSHSTDRMSWTTCESPLGRLTLTAADGGLTGLYFPGHAPQLPAADRRPEPFAAAIAQLGEYFAGRRRTFHLRLDLTSGTPFQRAVWDELRAIPYGETVTYGEVARRIGRADRVRAVGAANGRNPLPIIVACHRVIGADGTLTGYRGGLERKRALLDAEAAVARGDGTPEFRPRQLALIDGPLPHA